MNKEEKADILLVEDEEDLRTITSMQLRRYGYRVLGAACGSEALEILKRDKVDIILLDILLPDCDGHKLCEQIRGEEIAYTGPIIFMSCLGDSDSIVDAFRKGGDDYLVKPAKTGALVERIEENLKKNAKKEMQETKSWYKQFMIDRAKRSVYRVCDRKVGEEIALSPTEYNILLALVEHPDEVILYRQLYKSVWGVEDFGDVRTLMVHVSNLRKKLDGNHTELIRAIRGAGYLFQDV